MALNLQVEFFFLSLQKAVSKHANCSSIIKKGGGRDGSPSSFLSYIYLKYDMMLLWQPMVSRK